MLQREKHRKKETNPASKKQKLFNENYEKQLFNDNTVSDDFVQESEEVEPTVDESSFIDEECVDEEHGVIDTYRNANSSGKLVSNQGSVSDYIFKIRVVCQTTTTLCANSALIDGQT